ncbi:MAG TPA: type IV pilus assembly protein PilM [Planctomycetota bacterium]|nr:type IV pilus assembly protein PilM [Planctomycetota bacterium]
MAGAVWGIDIGKAALKAVKLRAIKGEGLEIKAVEHIDYEGSATEEEARQDQVRQALKTFTSKYKVRGDRVLVALPGLHAFSRFIKLPPVDAKKIGMMVRMEAQQQIPFPINEVNWDFTKIDRVYEPGEEIEVGIFATQKERITGFLNELKTQGLEPGIVTIAPLSIYNFMSYNTDFGDEAVVVLDIGSDHSDLVVINGPRFWIRNLRIAGNDITKALADRFKVSFDEAEKLKRNASKSDQSKKIFSSMEPTLKDLVGEVHRSVGFFKSQAPGGELKIQRMVLLGDGAKLKNLPPFFEKELGYPVEKVAKLEQDKFVLDPEVDVEMLKKHLLGFGVALGLAIQGAEVAKCSINLAPEDIKINEELRRKVPWAVGAAVCAWGAFGLSHLTWSNWRDQLKATIDGTKNAEQYPRIRQEAETAKAAAEAALAKTGPLKGIVVARTLPLDMLRELKKILPDKNGKIPENNGVLNPTDTQRQQILKERKDSQTDNKLWILEMQVDKKASSADPTKDKGPSVEGVYTVTLKVARPQPQGLDPSQVRTEIIQQLVTPTCKALKDGPYFVKNPDRTTADAWYAANENVSSEITTAGQTFPNLDHVTATQYKENFQVLVCEVKFDVGMTPPAPAAPAGEEKK